MAPLLRILRLLVAGAALLWSAQSSAQHQDDVRAFGTEVEPSADEPGAHGSDHVPHFSDINWFHGLLGEKEGVEPDLLYRPKGMPAPLGAMLINTAILFWLLGRYGRRPVALALKKRKQTIMTGMEDAARMRKEARLQLKGYEKKLADIDQEIERLQSEMRAAGQAERARILAEAKEKHARMERDARTLVEQELKAAREALLAETVRAAIRSAEERLRRDVTAADQQRLAEEYLANVGRAVGGRR
jgi:F-type H+-transporting ATPase subunit b